jgi:hypothetical protein
MGDEEAAPGDAVVRVVDVEVLAPADEQRIARGGGVAWNALTAAIVDRPRIPSIGPGSKPCAFSAF